MTYCKYIFKQVQLVLPIHTKQNIAIAYCTRVHLIHIRTWVCAEYSEDLRATSRGPAQIIYQLYVHAQKPCMIDCFRMLYRRSPAANSIVPDWGDKINPMPESTILYPPVRDYKFGYWMLDSKFSSAQRYPKLAKSIAWARRISFYL